MTWLLRLYFRDVKQNTLNIIIIIKKDFYFNDSGPERHSKVQGHFVTIMSRLFFFPLFFLGNIQQIENETTRERERENEQKKERERTKKECKEKRKSLIMKIIWMFNFFISLPTFCSIRTLIRTTEKIMETLPTLVVNLKNSLHLTVNLIN